MVKLKFRGTTLDPSIEPGSELFSALGLCRSVCHTMVDLRQLTTSPGLAFPLPEGGIPTSHR